MAAFISNLYKTYVTEKVRSSPQCGHGQVRLWRICKTLSWQDDKRKTAKAVFLGKFAAPILGVALREVISIPIGYNEESDDISHTVHNALSMFCVHTLF